MSLSLSTGASKSGGFGKIAGVTGSMSNLSAPDGLSMLKCAASLPPRVHSMPSRSCSDEALKVAARDQLFSAKSTVEGPETASSSITLPAVTTTSAVTSLVPSLTCSVNS